MKLGFLTAIVPDLSLEEIVDFAAEEGFECLEVCCWPPGKAERRYAGVTHINVEKFGAPEAARVKELCESIQVEISGLGYYPNPLAPDATEAKVYINHLKKVIRAAGCREALFFLRIPGRRREIAGAVGVSNADNQHMRGAVVLSKKIYCCCCMVKIARSVEEVKYGILCVRFSPVGWRLGDHQASILI